MTAAESLQNLREVLERHAKSPDLPRLLEQWRDDATLAPLAVLPPAYDQVRRSLLQRLDMAVSFGEESCSFSPASLLAEMRLWTDKAEAKLAAM
ncbi:hypothetical protein [Ralstonia mannitolilytica]|uniref:Uncharacterized protein n=1 Tax=Ralstonia mannitolilytica TaxID=105219 RepID=A0AAD2EF20_9RALS|nr:hypothetical protein [Ralstonia mannitolilytica]MBY4719383.1 hypothetical protein [Ralstonia mannitolilytica]CAJ0679180.1 hypothetical protein R77591_00211 [Ralstonia mannitolilytica]CAJ0697382.1 hypothetical protein LMG18102_02490 [Ralstonia mannitolilytica]CAJ0717652.1 hypothetical protein LMG8323_03655 [Ralstonia mannitolilytica]CAJ0788427.1 hypothetical protein LMG18090_02262 [Ralstonia mannitolilytica]